MNFVFRLSFRLPYFETRAICFRGPVMSTLLGEMTLSRAYLFASATIYIYTIYIHRYATPTEVYFETLIAERAPLSIGHYCALVATRQEIRSVYLRPLVLLRAYSISNSIPSGLMRIYQSECNLVTEIQPIDRVQMNINMEIGPIVLRLEACKRFAKLH